MPAGRGPGPNGLPGVEERAEVTLAFEDNRLAGMVFGHYDQNLAHIERRLGVTVNALGNHVVIKGVPDATDKARHVLENLYERARGGAALTLGDVDGAIQESAYQGTLFPPAEEPAAPGRPSFDQIVTRKRGAVRARNGAQDAYIKALRQHELVFAEGPAGTGKTWLAVGHAVSLLEQGQADRLILSRPAVEAGERLGFLPGDMREKVDPYLRPIYDEAQNTTSMQMKMFLTRLGEGSRMIVNGDPTQIDLPPGQKSGLIEAVRILTGVEGIARIVFREADVVRHDLVRRIVTAYDAVTRAPPEGRGP